MQGRYRYELEEGRKGEKLFLIIKYRNHASNSKQNNKIYIS